MDWSSMNDSDEDMIERLEEMKRVWTKLHAEGVPRGQWPLDADLPWGLQLSVQTEIGRPGSDADLT